MIENLALPITGAESRLREEGNVAMPLISGLR
jgi:hypothetical protein